MDEDTWDVLILGTGVTESVLSAALSRTGKRVLHVDPSPYYGGASAGLTLRQLSQWAADGGGDMSFPRDPSVARGEIPAACIPVDLHYSLCLRPTLLPCRGPMIEALIRSNVASHATFRLLDYASVWTDGSVRRVPGSKSDIFTDKDISLADKRRLMRFLQLAGGTDASDAQTTGDPRSFPETLQGLGLDAHLLAAIQYGVSLCWNGLESSDTALARTRRYIQGVGRYGDSAFLVGQYGGAAELVQGFCRSSAVHGGVFVLGHAVASLSAADAGSRPPWRLQLEGIPDVFHARHLVAAASSVDRHRSLHMLRPFIAGAPSAGDTLEHVGIVVTDAPLRSSVADAARADAAPSETALLVFPPHAVRGGDGEVPDNENAVFVLMQGEGTFSCPKGQYVYYLTTFTRAGTSSAPSATAALAPAVRLLQTLLQQPDARTAARGSTPAPSDGALSDGAPSDGARAPVALFFCTHRIPSLVHTTPPPAPFTPIPESRSARSPGTPASSLWLHDVDAPAQSVPNLTETLDLCVEEAESVFWQIVGESHRRSALQAASVRAKQHDPAEYQGRGGVDPVTRHVPEAGLEFFAPQATGSDDAV
ncbi:hypothetical protein MSPP1_001299 [Malassezia sp. CBS 17886]|nr:hypothetical protein MSPP1_001299 [Malassezia sp. CBS 17886]